METTKKEIKSAAMIKIKKWYDHLSFSKILFAVADGVNYNEALAKHLNVNPAPTFRQISRLLDEKILIKKEVKYRVIYDINYTKLINDTLEIWLLNYNSKSMSHAFENKIDSYDIKRLKNSGEYKKHIYKLKQRKYNFKDLLKFIMKQQKDMDLTYKQFATKVQFEMIPNFLKSISKRNIALMGQDNLFDLFETLNSMLEEIDQKTNINPVKKYFSKS